MPDREALLRLAGDLRAAWDAPTVDPALKQRLVRALVEEIIVDVDDATRELVLVIHWKGGVHSEVRARKPASGEHRCRTSPTAAALIRDRAGRESDAQIADALTARGERTGQGLAWTAERVRAYRQTAGIAAYASAAQDGGWLTMSRAATALGVSDAVIRRLIQRGVLPARQVMPDAPWQIRAEDLQTPAVQTALRTRRTIRRAPRPATKRSKSKPAKTAKR